ncbi:hypothetical protein M8J77_003427 [Diaphorina citri]|nr:hypothetical protein M8J77_003427 [Diaphorina citri]
MLFMFTNMKLSLFQGLLEKSSASYFLLCALLSFIFIIRYRRRHYYKVASKLKGPPQWPLIGAAKLYANKVSDLHEYHFHFRSIGERLVQCFYADFFLIFTLDANTVNFVLNKILRKAEMYRIVSNLFRDGVLGLSSVEKWRIDRKMIAPSFHYSVVKTYICIFFEETNILVDKFRPLMEKGESFYPGTMLNLATFDMVIRSTLGENPEAQEFNDHPVVKAMMGILESAQNRLLNPILMSDNVCKLLGYNKAENELQEVIRGYSRNIVRQIAASNTSDNTMSFARHMMTNNIDEEDLVTQIINVIFAGTDTTKTANFAVLLMLALHPEVQDKAYEEVISILGTDKTKEPSYEDLQNMRYVEMIIKESLRLYPPVPVVGRQIITDHETFEDLKLPRGAGMVVNVYTIHRDPVYYPDPNKFDPDRFLPGEAAKRPVGSYVPFLVGPRDCLGKKYAMLQMKTVASTILRNYRILPSPTCANMEQVVLEMSLFTVSYFLVCAIVFLYCIIRYRRRHFYKVASKLKGPPQWPFIGAGKLFGNHPSDLHEHFFQFRSLGERLAQTSYVEYFFILCLDASATNFALTKILEKIEILSILSALFRDGVLGFSPLEKWRADRKMLAPSFHLSLIKTYICIFFEETNILVDKFRPLMEKGESFYPGTLLNLATFDMVIRSTLGENPKAQDFNDHPVVEAMNKITESIHKRITNPWLVVDIISYLMGYKKAEAMHEDVIRKYSRNIVKQLAVSNSYHSTMSFARNMMTNNIDEEDLVTQIINVIFAGTDTTKTANFAVLLMLALHPEVQDKAYEEVISILGTDKTKEPSYEDLQNMRYLEMIIKESLRLYPPVPIVARQIFTDHEIFEDVELPRGTLMVVNVYTIHRDPVYYPDPNKFDPDRFLPGEAAKRPVGSYVPFLVGPRDCLGKKYAMLQMKTVASTILRNYRILPSPTCANMEQVVLETVMTSQFADNCQIRLESRN